MCCACAAPKHTSHPRTQGQWSIGLYRGPSPFALQPLELAQPPASTDGAWPVSNPVFTCAHVTDKHSSFVADPFIWPMPDGKVRGGFQVWLTHMIWAMLLCRQVADGGW